MINFMVEMQPWHWLAGCFLILGLEALGAGGFLLGVAVACLGQAALDFLIPEMSWSMQLGSFGVQALIYTVLWWVYFRKSGVGDGVDLLNNRAAQQVGQTVVLEDDIPCGVGRIQIGDTLWKVESSVALKAGTIVRVTGVSGMTLLIDAGPDEPVNKT